MNIFHSVAELAGNTPLLELCRYEHKHGLNARILAKLECCNVAGSAKDRVAKHMIGRAEAEGKLVPGSVIIEPTSGNTGIGLAAMAKVHGYRVILTMPESMSVERRNLLKAYGAELVLTPAAEGMAGAVKRAEELAAATPRSFIPAQFDNPANPEAHYLTTGPELWRDTDGCVDLFVAGIGTGGTFSGTGRYLKEKNPDVKLVAVEPAGSPLLSGGKAGPHGLMGIGATSSRKIWTFRSSTRSSVSARRTPTPQAAIWSRVRACSSASPRALRFGRRRSSRSGRRTRARPSLRYCQTAASAIYPRQCIRGNDRCPIKMRSSVPPPRRWRRTTAKAIF